MGCGPSKEKETAQAPSAGGGAPAEREVSEKGRDEVKAERSVAATDMGKKDEDGKMWISDELKSMMNDYFTRYDLDGSGTINSAEELKQLCTNLVVKLELDMDVTTIDAHVSSAGNMEDKEKGNWNFDTFLKWYLQMFEPLSCWQPQDQSSSDDECTDGAAHVRAGTYDLNMADGYTVPFKLRYSDDEHTTLFKRTANDERLGWNSKGIPNGLYSIVGTFDQAGKTCKLTKSYDVDMDASTKEPVFEFDGTIVSHKKIEGTWKNTEKDPRAIAMLKDLGLPESGKFTMDKRKKDE